MELSAIIQQAELATADDEFRIISEAALAIFGRQDERYKRVLRLLKAGASIDAAMSLVPEGWALARLAEWVGLTMRNEGPWQAALTCLTPRRQRIEVEHAATPALALCIAALKARESSVVLTGDGRLVRCE